MKAEADQKALITNLNTFLERAEVETLPADVAKVDQRCDLHRLDLTARDEVQCERSEDEEAATHQEDYWVGSNVSLLRIMIFVKGAYRLLSLWLIKHSSFSIQDDTKE